VEKGSGFAPGNNEFGWRQSEDESESLEKLSQLKMLGWDPVICVKMQC